MFPIMLVKDKEIRDQVKLSLKMRGYGYTTIGLQKFQLEHGLPVSNIITDFTAKIIINE